MNSFFRWLKDFMNPPGYQPKQTRSRNKYKTIKLAEENHDYQTKSVCPNCGKQFKKMPKSQKTCPECSIKSLVRKHYHTSEKILVPEEALEEYKKNKYRYYKANEMLRKIDKIQDDTFDFESLKRSEVKKLSNKFNQPPSKPDLAWGIANKVVTKLLKQECLETASLVYYQMGLYLHRVGRDHLESAKQARKLKLKVMQSKGWQEVEIQPRRNACDECSKLEGKIFRTDKALSEFPLPHEGCQKVKSDRFDPPYGWCDCTYRPKNLK